MAMNFDAPEVLDEFRDVFGHDPTEQQLRWVLKVAKHCRSRCRSNAALYNWSNRNFKDFVVTEKTVEDKPYPVMSIQKVR